MNVVGKLALEGVDAVLAVPLLVGVNAAKLSEEVSADVA